MTEMSLLKDFEALCKYVRECTGDDIVCGLCEYDAGTVGEEPMECPGFESNECFVLKESLRKQYEMYAQVIRCKDCKHRPVYDEQKREMPPRLNIEYDEDGEPWIWDDDMTCPYLCGDSYYNQMPDDEQFCDRGEREEE